MISGGGSNLQAILERCADGGIDGKVVFVGADTPDAGGLDRARSCGVPTFVVDYRDIIQQCRLESGENSLPGDADLKDLTARQHLIPADTPPDRLRRFLVSRVCAERALLDAMAPYPFDLLVLAGFMRTLTPYFIDRINTDPSCPRVMNIHPALLPAFPGVDGYGDTYRYGCKVAGATVHFIDYGEDTGPIIGQRAVPIRADDTLEALREKGLAQEWELYPECIQLYAQNRLRVRDAVHTVADGSQTTRRVVDILPESSG
jgi:phosphoribosylglycinamide formyltransferase-1